MAGLLFLGDDFGNRDKDFDCEQANTVLVVALEMLEERNHLIDDNLYGHLFHKFGQIVRRLSPHHRRLIMHQMAKLLTESLL